MFQKSANINTIYVRGTFSQNIEMCLHEGTHLIKELIT